MCGINAIFKFNGDKVNQKELFLMSSVIAHRGPDEAGYAILNNGKLGFANLRLSIIDLKNGLQPMYNEDQSIAVTYNGEIYDYKMHRENLIKKGHRLNNNSDTEVIIHLYEEYGIQFLEKINGEFAFLLWDDKKKKLFAVKDRFGIKPLFYYINNKEAIFSSENKGILALDRIERRFSPDYIAGMFLTLYSQSESTFFGLKCIKPGHYLEINENGTYVEKKYWEQRYEIDESIKFSDAKEGIRYYLTEAVKKRMVADIPVGVYLSGGVDSTLLCYIISKHNQQLKAFNIGFDDSIYDESHIAEQSAKYFNVKFSSIKCNMENLADAFEKTIYHNEAVIANPHSMAKQLLSAHVHASGFKVCITGEGGDECFAGYPYFKQEAIWHLLSSDLDRIKGKKLFKQFQKMESTTEEIMWDNTNTWKKSDNYLGYHNFFYNRALRGYPYMIKLFNTEALGITSKHSPKNLIKENYDFEYIRTLHPLNASRKIALNQLYSYMIPLLGDRVEMANSIECRVPYLDHELSDFVGKINPEFLLKIDDLREKYILREAFIKELPPHLQKGKKHTFLSPNWEYFSKSIKGKKLMDELLSDSALKNTNILNHKYIKQIIFLRKILPKTSNFRKRLDIPIGMALSLQMLHYQFIQNKINADSRFPMEDRSPKKEV